MPVQETPDVTDFAVNGRPSVPTAAEPDSSSVLSAVETDALRQRASEIVRELEDASGSRELALSDGIAAVGRQAQRRAGSELDFLRTRVGEMMNERGAAGQVTKDLVELRLALGKIAPDAAREGRALLRLVPFSRSLLGRLERVAIRYESVARQVMLIERRLVEGGVLLRRDNVELRKLYEDVESQQLPIERNAFLGEALIGELNALLARQTDPMKRERLQTLIFDVSMRVQDLRTMQEVHTQFFVSIEMTRVNNSRLGQAIDRTLSLTTSTLMVGLAIQAALSRQRRVLEATNRTRQFLGDLIAVNAATIKEHVTDIGDVYRNPVIAIEKLSQAHADLIEAMNTAGRLQAEGIEIARSNIEKLRQLTSELTQRTGVIAKGDEPAALEA